MVLLLLPAVISGSETGLLQPRQDRSTIGVTPFEDGKTRVDGDGVFRPIAVRWAREIAADLYYRLAIDG